MSISDLWRIAKTEFETQIVRDVFREICENIFEVSLNDLSEKFIMQSNEEISRYFYLVCLLNLEEKEAQGKQILNILRNSFVLFKFLETLQPALIELYDSLILK